MDLLSRNEELLLLAVWKLQDNAYGLAVRDRMSSLLGKAVSVGAVYVPLERLARKGLLRTREGAPTERRGGRRTRFYTLTAKGVSALSKVRDLQKRAWTGLPDLAGVRG